MRQEDTHMASGGDCSFSSYSNAETSLLKNVSKILLKLGLKKKSPCGVYHIRRRCRKMPSTKPPNMNTAYQVKAV
jgi:hypothetical protein